MRDLENSIFSLYIRIMQSLAQGKLLIAEPELKDENFDRTVILLCRYGEAEGAFGFVINRHTGYFLNELVPEVDIPNIPVFQGGPVQLDTVHFIHRYPELLPDAQLVAGDVYWGGNFDHLREKLAAGEIDMNRIKFFLGYSGWDAGQLEHEIAEKTWVTSEATNDLIFTTKDDVVWRNSMINSGPQNTMRIHYPTDSQLN